MPSKLTGLFAALAAALVVVLVAPTGALACSGTSAVCVYSQQGPAPGGAKPLTGPGGQPQPAVAIPSGVAQKISQSHATTLQKKALQSLVQNPSFAQRHNIQALAPGSVVAPSALGAAFDVGPGPIALIAVLGGTAALLLVGTGWRGWRRWRGGRLAG